MGAMLEWYSIVMYQWITWYNNNVVISLTLLLALLKLHASFCTAH